MIYNMSNPANKFEETWVLNESPDWWAFINLFSTSGLSASKEIKFTSNGTEFSKIEADWT